MPKPTKGGIYKKQYSEDELQASIEAVKNGMSKRAAATKFGVPRGTLQFRLHENFIKTRPGPPTVLTMAEENTLVEWIIDSCRKGFPRRKEDLLQSVTDFLKSSPRPNSFINNKPGEGWYKLFLKRHPEIVHRTAEAVTSASANVSETNLKQWFHQIETCLKEEKCFHILENPNRIFNGDETNFLLCPKTSKVLALKGTRDVYEVDNAPAKCGLTVMFTFSASGVITPPMIIYPLKRNRADIAASVPPEWGIGLSSNGWMNKDLFLQYITNIFYPYLVKENIELPIILFVDGHKSHINFELSKVCKEMGIILIALYPNATRILQPADVAAFKPIKDAWKKGVLEWRRKNISKNLTKIDFAPILSTILKKYINKNIIVNGFRACGLYPWNPNAINFKKCLGKNVTHPAPIPDNNQPQRTITLTDFENIVGPVVVSHLMTNAPDESNCFYKALKDVFKCLKGEAVEQKDKTIEKEYSVVNDELSPINDIQIVISSSNNKDEFHEKPIEIETENFELLPADFLNDFEIVNLSESETFNLSKDIQNIIEIKDYDQSQIMEDTDAQSHSKSEIISFIKPTSDDVVKEPFQLIIPKLTTIAEIHNIDERNAIIENSDVTNEKSNETAQSKSVLDHAKESSFKANINIQNKITNTQNSKEHERISNYENAEFNNEITPPKLKDTLNWPATPQRKGKLISNNPVYVLTSHEWLKIEEKKKNEKETKEKEKEERKKVREEKRNQAVKKVTINNKNTKNVKINSKNTELLRQEKKNLKCPLKSDSESKENDKEDTQIELKERKRKQDISINSANIKKVKIDSYHNKTEKNSLKYVNTETEFASLKCKTEKTSINTKTEKLDPEKIPKPKALSETKEKQNNVEILSVVNTQVNIDLKNIFDKNSCVNTKEPFILPKPTRNTILNRRETFRNIKEFRKFVNGLDGDTSE